MLKLEHTEVVGWEAAIRGMRNPMNSWDKSDSHVCYAAFGMGCPMVEYNHAEAKSCNNGEDGFCIGQNDLALMRRLAGAGPDHGKFLRMINVTVDITAPLYWWKEADTYKVGTVANSCSTMHKIAAKEFTLEDFSYDHLNEKSLYMLNDTIKYLNAVREAFLDTKDKDYWWQMIQLLPSSYNQRRTVQLNYEVLRRMHHARRAHKLDEWRTLCAWAERLPYFREICIEEGT